MPKWDVDTQPTPPATPLDGAEHRALPSVTALPPETLIAEARAASDFLKALGHEGRLRMLYHLCERDLTVSELEHLVMSRQAAVSQQLARLRHEKLVSTRRDGNQIIYSLADDRVREIVLFLRVMFEGQGG